ncbi:MAG: hypothetical protein AB8C13_10325 [Phycisphaerales bacterium]
MNRNRKEHTVQVLSGMLLIVVSGSVLGTISGCENIRKRRVDVVQPTGADGGLDARFGLTSDAQDPSERDKELGYGRWKAKPEADGTDAPSSPDRRKPIVLP